jgi:hypothetical protein
VVRFFLDCLLRVRLLDSVAAGCTVIALSKGLFLAGVFSRGELQGALLQSDRNSEL